MTNKIRIHKLAKDAGIDYKELIKEAQALGLAVKSHASSVTEEEAELILGSINEQVEDPAPVKAEKTQKPAEVKAVEKPDPEIKKEEKIRGKQSEDKQVKIQETEKDKRKDIRPRAPVVTVMGHVDHGKTQLLDTIRNTNVIAKESGGITQHVGAYKVDLKSKGQIIFIDTPGHEAFTAMRARGAGITDIVVLVVSGEDGVMPQTIEAINHAKAAKVPMIVAINKMDLPAFDPEKVLTQLSHQDVLTEKWGGEVIAVEISAKMNQHIDDLLEMILLQAEMMELKTAYDGPAEAIIVESELDKRMGPTATVIITKGVLSVGDCFISGSVPGKVKALTDDRGERVQSADPNMPVKVLGFEELPSAGDDMITVKDRNEARSISEEKLRILNMNSAVKDAEKAFTLEDLQRRLMGDSSKELNIILKTDMSGSLEAVRDTLLKLKNDEVSINIIHSGVGAVTKKDIMLASASEAIIIGFNISTPGSIKKEAEREGIQIRNYRIIYDIINDIKKALEGMLEPEEKEVLLGQALVKKIYNISGVGTVAGCSVVNGLIKRNTIVRVVRDSKIVYIGKMAALKRFKNDAAEVAQGYECGISIENFNDIKVDDIIESCQIEEKRRSLEELS